MMFLTFHVFVSSCLTNCKEIPDKKQAGPVYAGTACFFV